MTQQRGISNAFITRFDVSWENRQQVADAALLAAGYEPRLVVVDPRAAPCGNDSCRVEHDGQALFRDSNHLSVAGAVYVSESLAACFDALE